MDENIDTTIKNNQLNKEFDYFYVILNHWKLISLVCIAFLLIGLSYLWFTPKSQTAKSTFSITLNKRIETAYGSYQLKTINPIYYLRTIEQEWFKDSVLTKLGDKNLKEIDFEVKEEEVLSKTDESIIPEKFDLNVYGPKGVNISRLNEAALSMFVERMDQNFHDDMFRQFYSDLTLQIDNLKFSIDLKEKLIEDLKINLKGGAPVKTSDENYRELIDDRLIKNLEGSERALIVSMMLSGDKRYEHYQESMLTIEEVSLKTLLNSLERRELLLNKLVENNDNGTLASIFKLPFGDNYYLLTPPEEINVSLLNKYLKIIFVFVFLGFFISTSYILVREYYNLNYK